MKKPILLILLLICVHLTRAQQPIDTNQLNTAVTRQATFAGPGTFFQFIAQNIRYPINAYKNHQQGKVIVRFIVETNGQVANAIILQSASPELDTEALRVVRLSRWVPGVQNGRKVRVKFVVPITFNLPPDNSSQAKIGANLNADSSGHQSKPLSDEDLLGQTSSDVKPAATFNDDQIFTAVMHQPEFPGGQAKFDEYIAANKQSGEESGRVIAQFVVEKDGSLSNFKILRSPSDALSDETIRLLSKSPKWTPGMQNGRVVRCYFTMPLRFNN